MFIKTLKLAASRGNVARVKMLVEAGADVNKKDYFGTTSLARAARAGHEECVEFLLRKGTDVNITERFRGPLFHLI